MGFPLWRSGAARPISARLAGTLTAFALLCLASSGDRAFAQSFDPQALTGLHGDAAIDPALLQGVGRAEVSRAYIPDAIDLSPSMPPPLLQIHGSCVSYAIGYAIRGYYAALENNVAPGSRAFTPSPAFLHSQIRDKDAACENAGSHAYYALSYFKGRGAPDLDAIPDSAMCSERVERPASPPDRFKIRDFEFIYAAARDKRPVSNRDLDAIKQQLAAGHPVAAGYRMVKVAPSSRMPEGVTLQYLKAGEIYQGSLARNDGWDTGHQMVLVGYDERRQAFLVQNSWGPYWSGDGFGWISYDATRADLRNASVMRTAKAPPRPVPGITRLDHGNQIALKGDSCSSLYVTEEPPNGMPLLGGFVSTQSSLAKLRDEFPPEQVQKIAVRPWPVCEVLKTLARPLTEPSRPSIRLLGGSADLAYGDSLAFEVTAPDFASFLYIVYLQADGTVVNLLPRRGPVRRQVPFGESFRFGDGRGGRQTFTVSPPAGAEAIVVIAAHSPIAQLEELENTGNGQFTMPVSADGGTGVANDRYFLTALRAGLAERPEETRLPREISAAVLHLTIRAD
ncbi:DUF4384 domain-containing protein [Roseibium sediminicola]|uniref:DUF4384 domain-containing protein n=1 Tax=Roseibium sediminicola TaxID=2933272 RepID=A0ABT0GTD7_9HYPH|nr:DUF4384 domain-containing protein [Roseibium sp. CAU 1639]MCK7612551.1 DUF4384 domain-containing protein [Roseibium sp. CAU 1639]